MKIKTNNIKATFRKRMLSTGLWLCTRRFDKQKGER